MRRCPTADRWRQPGLPGFEVGIWHGLYAPKGTPPEVIEQARRQRCRWRSRTPRWSQRFADSAPSPSEAEATPAALEAKLESEIARWKPIIEAAGQYAD